MLGYSLGIGRLVSRRSRDPFLKGLDLVSVSDIFWKVSSRSRLGQKAKRLGLVSVSEPKVSFTSDIFQVPYQNKDRWTFYQTEFQLSLINVTYTLYSSMVNQIDHGLCSLFYSLGLLGIIISKKLSVYLNLECKDRWQMTSRHKLRKCSIIATEIVHKDGHWALAN